MTIAREDLPRARSGADEAVADEAPVPVEPEGSSEPVEVTIAREDLPRARSGADEPATAQPTDAGAAPAAEDAAAGTPDGAWWTRNPRTATFIAATLAVVLLVATFFAGGALLGPDPEGPFTAPSGEAPVEPVAGWTRQADWISPELAEASRGVAPLHVDGTIVTTVTTTSGTALVAIRAEDGTRLWLSPIEGTLTGPPQVVTHGDEPAIVAATDHTLMVWPGLGAAGEPPTPQTWDFTEAGLELVPGSRVPLLANAETRTARVLVGDELELMALRSGRAITAGEEGTVITVSPEGHWSAQAPGKDPSEATLLQPPAFGSLVDTVLGTVDGTLVVSWTHDAKRSHLAGYDTGDQMELLWKASVPGHPTQETFRASPDGEWAIAAGTAIDLGNGDTERLPRGWETVAVTNERAWSSEDVVTRTGRVSPLDETVADAHGVPVMVTSGGLGVVVAPTEGGAARMYALRPGGDGADA